MVEVNGRTLPSNGCTRCSDCFNCDRDDCKATTQEIVMFDNGHTEEYVQVRLAKAREQNARSLKRHRERLKEKSNGKQA